DAHGRRGLIGRGGTGDLRRRVASAAVRRAVVVLAVAFGRPGAGCEADVVVRNDDVSLRAANLAAGDGGEGRARRRAHSREDNEEEAPAISRAHVSAEGSSATMSVQGGRALTVAPSPVKRIVRHNPPYLVTP